MQNFLEVTFFKKMSANYDYFSSIYFVYNIQLSPKGEANSGGYIQLFRERLSDKVHAATPKGIVGCFEFTVFQRNLKEW